MIDSESMVLNDRVVVITGAGSGIGRSLAIGFCRDGARVIGFGRTERTLQETAQLCNDGRMDYVVGDVSSEADVTRLFQETLQRYGKVDILVANAAIYPKQTFLEMSHSDWTKVIETNLNGAALCCRKVLPSMLEKKYGRIILLGSFAGRAVIPASSAYSVSKAGLSSLTKALAVEIDRALYPNVLVNELVPGATKTSMSLIGGDPQDVYSYAYVLATLPANGPTGRIFTKGKLHHEDYRLKTRLKRLFLSLLGRENTSN
ncbi:MAG: SDR family NAD(P)-dependent oxidoreductase [Cyanobacteriota bacterium]|jgi:2-hydroxycyclohexanecarboxyl-CoA dehydrogenase